MSRSAASVIRMDDIEPGDDTIVFEVGIREGDPFWTVYTCSRCEAETETIGASFCIHYCSRCASEGHMIKMTCTHERIE